MYLDRRFADIVYLEWVEMHISTIRYIRFASRTSALERRDEESADIYLSGFLR